VTWNWKTREHPEIDGTDVAEDIARVLEKNGVIKIKGDMIKWKV